MLILEYITSGIPIIGNDENVAQVLKMMNEWHVYELALVLSGKYQALIKEEDLLQWNNLDDKVVNTNNLSHNNFVKNSEHPYSAACIMAENSLSILPVTDEENNYLGALTREELFNFFCDNSGLNQSGGILSLTIKQNAYSLSEISRICENNDAVVLNVQQFIYPGQNLMDVILKTDSKDLRGLKASFERYEYKVKEVYGNLPVSNDTDDRYRLLMNYINM